MLKVITICIELWGDVEGMQECRRQRGSVKGNEENECLNLTSILTTFSMHLALHVSCSILFSGQI